MRLRHVPPNCVVEHAYKGKKTIFVVRGNSPDFVWLVCRKEGILFTLPPDTQVELSKDCYFNSPVYKTLGAT